MRAVEELRAVAAAITFQTRLPLGRRIAVGGGDVALAAALPYARAEGGTGVSLTTGGRIRAFVGATLAVGIALAAAGTTGAAMAGVALAVAVVAAFAFRAWLGGVTGDTLGAVVELTETAGLVTALAILA